MNKYYKKETETQKREQPDECQRGGKRKEQVMEGIKRHRPLGNKINYKDILHNTGNTPNTVQ